MSLEAMIWALRDVDCTPAEKLVLTILCQFIDDHTDCAWPSCDTVRRWTGQSQRTIYRAYASLEGKGLIARPTAQQRRKGRFAQNVVHIALHGPAVPPNDAVMTACMNLAAQRRPGSGQTVDKPSPSAKMADGPSANLAPTVCQNGRRRSMDDPVSLNPDRKNPVSGDRAAPRDVEAPSQRDRKYDEGLSALQRRLATLQQSVARYNAALANVVIGRLTVDGDVVQAPSQVVIDQIKKRLSTDFRIFGIDVDKIVVRQTDSG